MVLYCTRKDNKFKKSKMKIREEVCNELIQEIESYYTDNSVAHEAHKNFVIHTIIAAYESIQKKEEKAYLERGRFYKDLEKGEAVAFIDEIIERSHSSKRAGKMIELFVNNEYTMEEIDDMYTTKEWIMAARNNPEIFPNKRGKRCPQ